MKEDGSFTFLGGKTEKLRTCPGVLRQWGEELRSVPGFSESPHTERHPWKGPRGGAPELFWAGGRPPNPGFFSVFTLMPQQLLLAHSGLRPGVLQALAWGPAGTGWKPDSGHPFELLQCWVKSEPPPGPARGHHLQGSEALLQQIACIKVRPQPGEAQLGPSGKEGSLDQERPTLLPAPWTQLSLFTSSSVRGKVIPNV